MFEETKWRRTKDTRPRNQVVEDAVREGCNALIRLCQERRFKPAQHDYEPE
jgi:hypothetical protein